MSEENINLSKSNEEVNTKNMNEYSKQTYDNQANYTNQTAQTNYNSNNFVNNYIKNNYIPWLIAGIVQLMCCNQITGIITIMLSFLANEDYIKGRIDDYKSKIKCAKIATIIGVILSVLIYVFIILCYVSVFILALFE